MSEIEYSAEVDVSLEAIIEAILFAAGKPLTLDKIAALFPEEELPEMDEIKLALENIKEDYQERGIELQKVASGYRFQVRQEMIPWIRGLWSEKPARYTRALLETLALIAYRQPITRGEIEEIRGVGVSSNIIRTLQEREWVRVVGRRDVPGRPSMYATTRHFLDYFNLKNLNELPPLGEIKNLEDIATKFEQGLQKELSGVESAIHRNQAINDQSQEEPLSKEGQVISIEKNQPINPEKPEVALVDHNVAKEFKEENKKADQQVFQSVDELLANVKTDFTDFNPEVHSITHGMEADQHPSD